MTQRCFRVPPTHGLSPHTPHSSSLRPVGYSLPILGHIAHSKVLLVAFHASKAARSPPDLIYLVDRTNNPASIVGSKSCMNKQISRESSVCVLKCTGVAPSTLLLTIDYAVMQIVSALSAPCIPSNTHSKHHSYSGHAGWSSSSSRSISRSAQTCASALLKKSFLRQIIGST